ncbi:MAG: tetratricopeptide repeat protein [Bacteroidota bacterium]
MKLNGLLVVFLMFTVLSVNAQKDSLVSSIIAHAEEVADQGNFDYAIKLLRKNARRKSEYPSLKKALIQMYFRAEEYKKSIRHARRYLRKYPAEATIFQYQAHSYLQLDKPEKAEKILRNGIEVMPGEGMLYAEMGRLHMHLEQYETALQHFETGIDEVPNYASNYYWASKIYLESTEELWGLLYGELFMNLERHTERTAELSELMYNTLNKEIVFYDDTAIAIKLSQDANIQLDSIDSVNYVSFGQDVVLPLMYQSLHGIDHLSIANIDRFRKRFIKLYPMHEQAEGFPLHKVFSLHQMLVEQGHFEAYNHWLFMMGHPEEFEYWRTHNRSQWKLFIQWFDHFDFVIDPAEKYHSREFR